MKRRAKYIERYTEGPPSHQTPFIERRRLRGEGDTFIPRLALSGRRHLRALFFAQSFILLWCTLALFSCTAGQEQSPPTNQPYALAFPAHFSRPVLPEGNPLTTAGIALGRRLFYDPILSADSTLACASCHLPERAFTDGRAVAVGVNQRQGRRNAQSLANAAYQYKGLFWDGRAATLEEQALIPVEDPNEMAHDWAAVERSLRQHPSYPAWFTEAFGIADTAQITRQLAAKALAQFQRTLISANSKYDRVKRGEAAFTELEERGEHIFFDTSKELPEGECGHCHTPPLFTDQTYMNNGLDEVRKLSEFQDKGRGGATGQYYDNGRFRVPSLRNAALTAPYMHDGRFATLEEVIGHYNQGGRHSENVDPKIRKLHLSDTDQQALKAFLETLTDSTFVNNPEYRNPF